MAENHKHNVTIGVRSRVVDRAIENVNAKQTELSEEFIVELRELLSAEKVPKADGYLQLFEKHAGGDS